MSRKISLRTICMVTVSSIVLVIACKTIPYAVKRADRGDVSAKKKYENDIIIGQSMLKDVRNEDVRKIREAILSIIGERRMPLIIDSPEAKYIYNYVLNLRSEYSPQDYIRLVNAILNR